jgi:S1-C subfamily serine protease
VCGVFAGIITSRALGADGIGFAVPIDQAVEQIPHILRNKPQVTPCMGCKLATLTPSLAIELNASPDFGAVVPKVQGVVVVEVLGASPASKSGIKKGDVIVSCDGIAASQVERVQKCVRRTKVGQCLKLELRRGAHGKLTTTVKLGEAEKVVREAAKAKMVAARSSAKHGGVPHGFFVIG